MKYIFFLVLLLAVILSSCAAPPEVPPTSTPKPTWTSKPHGILQACIYFDNELVDLGYLTFRNEKGNIKALTTTLIGGCKDVLLPPGSYIVVPHSTHGACGYTNYCRPKEVYLIDISDGEVIELDFEVFLPE